MSMPLLLTLAAAVTTGRVDGTVVDQGGVAVADAVVVVLDGETGVPVRHATWAPFPDGDVDMESAMADLVFARTDADGGFELRGVPAGDYRLLAQSWIEAPPPSDVLAVNGPVIHVRGTAAISVVAGETTPVDIRPLGDATLVLGDHAANDETLLVLSTSPPRGDVALGFMAWPGPFLRAMIGFNRMPDGVTTVHGLPEGEIHVAVFSADDNGGHGAASLTLDDDVPMYARIPILAPWSSGIHRPPPPLADLTARVAGWSSSQHAATMQQWTDLAADSQIPGGRMTSRVVARAISKAADHAVEIAEGESVPLLDVLAALRYAALAERLQGQGRTPNPWRPAESRPVRPKELLRHVVPLIRDGPAPVPGRDPAPAAGVA